MHAHIYVYTNTHTHTYTHTYTHTVIFIFFEVAMNLIKTRERTMTNIFAAHFHEFNMLFDFFSYSR